MSRRREQHPRRDEAKVVPIAGRVPPHDLDAEGAVLGACLLFPDSLASCRALGIDPAKFYSDANGRIFEAACDVADAGQPVTLITVAGRLRDTSRMQAVGGPSYLAMLVDQTPATVHLEAHASIVLAKWRARAVIAQCQVTLAKSYTGETDLDELLVTHRGELDQVDAVRLAAPTLVDQVLALGGEGPPMSLGLSHLDQCTRGGLRACRALVLAGAPGAGKTTLAVQIAHDLAIRGVHVAILASDESARGLLIRIGQLVGLHRDDLERGEELAREYLAGVVRGDLSRLALVDGDEDLSATVENVAAQLARRAAGAPALLVIDSIQTARALASPEADSPRARVDCVMAAIKRVKKIHNLAVIATSEVGRAFYRGGKDDSPDGLAAGKDSGGIEYGVDVQLVLRSIPDGDGDVNVEVHKNRLGSSKPSWRMRIDHDRARMSSIETAPPPTTHDRAAQRQAKEDASIDRMKRHVLEALVKSREPVPNVAALRRIVSGKMSVVQSAIARLVADGTITRVADTTRRNGVRLALASSNPYPVVPNHYPTVTQNGEVGAANPFPASNTPPEGGFDARVCSPTGDDSTPPSDEPLPNSNPNPTITQSDDEAAGAS